MRTIKKSATFGEIRLLVRRDGVSWPKQAYKLDHVESVLKAVAALPFAPTSHKELPIPSVAELYEDSKEAEGEEVGKLEEEVDGHMSIVHKKGNSVDFAWMEVECDDDTVIEKVMSFFPVHSSTKEYLRRGRNENEAAEIFPSCGYVSINVAAKHESRASLGDERDEPVMVSIIAFEQFLLTIHSKALAGGDEMRAQMELILSSSTSHMEPLSSVLCSLISSVVKEYQKEPSSLLLDVDKVNELVLQIQPSRCDQMDLLRRIENLRHRLSRVQASFLAKERLVQQLLLPMMQRIFITAEPDVRRRYQRLLSGLLLSIERLRKGRDVLNLTSMSLVSGVAMRLLQHCYWMDFLNSVMTQMSLVTMPICIIPGLFAMNVRVPFEETEGLTAFFLIASVTAVLFALGMAYPAFVYFRYKPPSALVPPSLS